MKRLLLILVLILTIVFSTAAQSTYVRINQAGFAVTDTKAAIVMSRQPIESKFSITDSSGKTVYTGQPTAIPTSEWNGQFPYLYRLEFTALQRDGKYTISLGDTSANFRIGAYPSYQEDL